MKMATPSFQRVLNIVLIVSVLTLGIALSRGAPIITLISVLVSVGALLLLWITNPDSPDDSREALK